jgi:hypothetical protein
MSFPYHRTVDFISFERSVIGEIPVTFVLERMTPRFLFGRAERPKCVGTDGFLLPPGGRIVIDMRL